MVFTLDEIVIGGLLHDIGKFMQRAHGGIRELPQASRNMESVICPTNDGRYTHKHVLWTDAFFEWMESQNLAFAKGVSLAHVRRFADSHHLPDSPVERTMGWMSAKADRYSSGMDRKPQQEAMDTGDAKGWDAFRKTRQRSIFDLVDLGLGERKQHSYRLNALVPGDSLVPETAIDEDNTMPEDYRRLWEQFCADFSALCRADLSPRLFEEGLLGLLERYAWALPSSTMDIPDISLYDHSRTVAGIAACLYRFHEGAESLDIEDAVQDDRRPKFRLLSGDLSGIQSTLFTLESQGVRGVAKILRARSFLLGAITEAASLRILDAFHLPLSCVLQLAGGRFLVLLPHLVKTEEVIERLRGEFDQWLLDNYTGSLALNIALSEPFAGELFQSKAFARVLAEFRMCIDEAKQRPLRTLPQGVLKHIYEYGPCGACGVRPARATADQSEEDRYCTACARERHLGATLLKAHFIAWSKQRLPGNGHANLLGIALSLRANPPEHASFGEVSSLRMVEGKADIPWARRYLANYVPRFKDDREYLDPVYKGIEEGDVAGAGDVKTFVHIAARAREPNGDDGFRGKPFLGVLKADVDRLGFIFACGLRSGEEDQLTLSRFVQLSRMMDLYFTGYLQELIRKDFPETYTIYAGGDDLLLIGPWRQMLELTMAMNKGFCKYTGHNPNITLSAGLELIHLDMPINRAVVSVEKRLESAKREGRNRFCAIADESLPWNALSGLMADAKWIDDQMRRTKDPVPTSFLYRLMELADDARAASKDPSRANWRARLGYCLRRNLKNETDRKSWLERLGLADLKGSGEALARWRLPLSIALYRNRD